MHASAFEDCILSKFNFNLDLILFNEILQVPEFDLIWLLKTDAECYLPVR